MFNDILREFYWSSVLDSVSKLPKEVIIGVAVTYGLVHMHDVRQEAKVKVAEYEARKSEADLEALKIKTFAVE